ncbi:hypothetical protein AX16_008448 [Volvariella volvacea WC 439]|nr:hypothetical protein AX16_008448 [Volvariella volvacea WC 439]
MASANASIPRPTAAHVTKLAALSAAEELSNAINAASGPGLGKRKRERSMDTPTAGPYNQDLSPSVLMHPSLDTTPSSSGSTVSLSPDLSTPSVSVPSIRTNWTGPPRNKRKQVHLKIDIPPPSLPTPGSPSNNEYDDLMSLFSDMSTPNSLFDDVEALELKSSNIDWTHDCTQDPDQNSTTDSNTEPTTSTSTPGQSATYRPAASRDQPTTLQPFPALRTAPPIPGLYFTPTLLLPPDLAESILKFCMKTYFSGRANQVMLFGRAPRLNDSDSNSEEPSSSSPSQPVPTSGFPPPLLTLLAHLSILLRPHIPPDIYSLLFLPQAKLQSQIQETGARQAIINLYRPGEGISSHVDLLGRFGDGIIGVSLGSGCVMKFDRDDDEPRRVSEGKDEEKDKNPEGGGARGRDRWDLYLPRNTVLVLSGDARYKWKHGIERRTEDLVCHDGRAPPPDVDAPALSSFESYRVTPLAESRLDPEAVSVPRGAGAEWIERGTRLSITFRWLLPGADIVGPSASS